MERGGSGNQNQIPFRRDQLIIMTLWSVAYKNEGRLLLPWGIHPFAVNIDFVRGQDGSPNGCPHLELMQ